MTDVAATSAPASNQSVATALSPLMAAVFIGFLVTGAALPVLPFYIRDSLGFGPLTIGVVAGCQFAAALVSRVGSGRIADAQGPKSAVIAGLLAAALAGLLSLASLGRTPVVALAALIAGRAALGVGESLIITGATTWGLARAGAQHAGKVIAWIGMAMFAALALGAPLGTALYARGGFGAVSLGIVVAPLLTLAVIAPLAKASPLRQRGPKLLAVLSRIWLPGLGAALSSVGFGAIAAFSPLLFADHGWTPVWLAFSAYAVALIIARALFGHLPDRIGGARVALLFGLIEVAGLLVMAAAPAGSVAALGAALTGFGYALVFPALGVEAVRRAPPQSRGIAMGAYTSCLDIAMGVAAPTLGAVAAQAGVSAVFLVSALVALGAAAVALRLKRDASRTSQTPGAQTCKSAN